MHIYPHLIHAGTLPTPQEHASIIAAKHRYQAQRTTLLQEIQALQVRLEEARNQLEGLDEQINAHSRLVSPLRRMPTEILRDIFALATPSSALQPVADRVLHAPWTTMEVCKHWNEVCLMYDSLWSRVTISPSSAFHFFRERPVSASPGGGIPPEHQPERHGYERTREQSAATFFARSAELLSIQLQRSKGADLHVTIALRPTSLDNYGQPYLRILLPHIHRASYLKAPYYILANTPLPRPLDRITEVDVHYHYYQPGNYPSPEEHNQVQNILEPRASVTKFSAAILGFPARMGAQHLNPQIYRLDTLTRLTINVVDGWTQLRPVLARLQALTHLQLTEQAEIESDDGQAPLEEDVDRISLPKLLMLSIDISIVPSQAETFAHIVTPRLEHLSCFSPGLKYHRSVERFFSASGCKLHTLRVQSIGDTDSTLYFLSNYEDAMDTVRTLEIIHIPGMKARYYLGDSGTQTAMGENDARRFIELLTPQGGNPGHVAESTSEYPAPTTVFPQLQALHLQNMKLPAQQLVDMLHSRRRPGLRTRLGSCSIANTHSVHVLLSSEELKKNSAAQARERARQFSYSRDDNSSDWAGWRSPRRSWFPDTAEHRANQRTLTWAEGLEREPEQKKRLERLVDEGLEIWM